MYSVSWFNGPPEHDLGQDSESEICSLDKRGRPQFKNLMFHRGNPPCFFAFDLLTCDGKDLRTERLLCCEVIEAEYDLWHGETIHPAGQASPWKSQLGKAASARSSCCYRVRNASPTLGTHEANMYRFSGVTELVRAE